jgi:predicted RND superfamily exporter protein
MARKITVQWHPSQQIEPVKLFDESGMYFDTVGIDNPTDFEFTADYKNSDSSVKQFTISLNPDSSDVKIIKNNSDVVRCTASYTQINQSIAFNIAVTSGSEVAHTLGGKPVIRNDPRRPFQGWLVAVGVVVAVMIVAVLLFHYF